MAGVERRVARGIRRCIELAHRSGAGEFSFSFDNLKDGRFHLMVGSGLERARRRRGGTVEFHVNSSGGTAEIMLDNSDYEMKVVDMELAKNDSLEIVVKYAQTPAGACFEGLFEPRPGTAPAD